MLTFDERDKTWAIRATFRVESEGDDHFVVERIEGQQGFSRYGPMPCDVTGPFIEERKAFFNDVIARRLRA